jgi:predicted dienelactone hydrolase
MADMIRLISIYFVLWALLLSSCAAPLSSPTPTSELTPTLTLEPTPTPILEPTPTLEPIPFMLSTPGPYFAGVQKYSLVDESRNNREIQLTIWYPALKQTDPDGHIIEHNAIADMSGAPYPMILTSPNTAQYLFLDHFVSYGFVMAIVGYPDSSDYWDFEMIDHPRDMIFALNQIASNSVVELEGVIDTDHVGVTGYSSDGDVALGVSGARIDPEFYLSHCEQATSMQPAPPAEWIQSICGLTQKWNEFSSHAGDEVTASDDGLWQPVTDERIRAVMIMSSGGAWLYGDQGLATVDLPLFIIAATNDEIVPYQFEAEYIFEHIGTPDRVLISFIGKGHMMVFNTEQSNRMKHFAIAFFGYYLQERDEYAIYFSEDFVERYDDLVWGVYK